MRTVNRRPPPSARDCWLRPCQTCTSTSLRWTWPASAPPSKGVLRFVTLYCRTRVCRRHSAWSVDVPVPLFQIVSGRGREQRQDADRDDQEDQGRDQDLDDGKTTLSHGQLPTGVQFH